MRIGLERILDGIEALVRDRMDGRQDAIVDAYRFVLTSERVGTVVVECS